MCSVINKVIGMLIMHASLISCNHAVMFINKVASCYCFVLGFY